MNPLLVIPCFNDNQYLESLLCFINKICNYQVLCIDDGSEDIVKINSKYSNCTLLTNKSNKGKGYCIIKASRYAIKNSFSHILVIDADMQHDPSKINEFINLSKDYDIVYGKRDFRLNMPYIRVISNYITSLIISIFCRKRILDSQCGFRRYKLDLFKQNNFNENGYQFESEILLKCINSNSKICYVEIPTIYNDNKSSISHGKDTMKFIKLIIRSIFK